MSHRLSGRPLLTDRHVLHGVTGVLDTRELIGGGASAPFTRNVPYETKDKFLAVAAWTRDEHAELHQFHDAVGILQIEIDRLRPRFLLELHGADAAQARQLVLSDRRYSTRHPLMRLPQRQAEMSLTG